MPLDKSFDLEVRDSYNLTGEKILFADKSFLRIYCPQCQKITYVRFNGSDDETVNFVLRIICANPRCYTNFMVERINGVFAIYDNITQDSYFLKRFN
ncbi:MAG: hypothetical protein ACTSPI_17410 [Candidatus Heimdallarchaeaceae archaeon]